MLTHDGYKLLLHLIQSSENHLDRNEVKSEKVKMMQYLLNENKKKLILELVETSLNMKLYFVTYNAIHLFTDEIQEMKMTNYISIILNHLRRDPAWLEIKLILVHLVIDEMNYQNARAFIQTAKLLIQEGPYESYLKHNLNPIRVALMLYKTIDDINNRFGFSKNLILQLQERICEQLVLI